MLMCAVPLTSVKQLLGALCHTFVTPVTKLHRQLRHKHQQHSCHCSRVALGHPVQVCLKSFSLSLRAARRLCQTLAGCPVVLSRVPRARAAACIGCEGCTAILVFLHPRTPRVCSSLQSVECVYTVVLPVSEWVCILVHQVVSCILSFKFHWLRSILLSRYIPTCLLLCQIWSSPPVLNCTSGTRTCLFGS